MWKRRRVDPDKVFDVKDAHIVRILSVQNPVLRSLVACFHHDYFDTDSAGNLMEFEKAKTVWRQDPHFMDRKEDDDGADLGGSYEDEMPDVDAYMSEVMEQASHEFNADKHDWYERHKRALHIRACVLVAYDSDRRTARVTADWCTLSASVTLMIKGQINEMERGDANAAAAIVDATQKSMDHGVEVAPTKQLNGQQFYHLLVEKGMHVNEARVHTTKFFETPSASVAAAAAAARSSGNNDDDDGDDTYVEPIVMSSHRAHTKALAVQEARSRMGHASSGSSVLGFDDVSNARMRMLNAAFLNTVTVEDLWARINESNLQINKFLGTEFISLALRMVLLSTELCQIREMYASHDVSLDTVARGAAYVQLVARLMRESPHVLCFAKLRRKYGEQFDVRTLVLLPDLPFDAYRRLTTQYHKGPVDMIKLTAVNMYGAILRYDVYGDKRPPTERSYSTGNSFSVFGAHDSDRGASYYHSTGESGARAHVADPAERLRDANTMSSIGQFAMPDDCTAPLSMETLRMLQPDVDRLEVRCTYLEFVQAIDWLIKEGIVVKRRFTGTGEHNAGKQVDAFFMSEVWDAQQRTLELLDDIYRRGVKQSVHHSPDELSDPHMIATVSQFNEARAEWRAEYLRLVAVANANYHDLAGGGGAGAANDLDENAHAAAQRAASAPANNPLVFAALARTIASALARLDKMYDRACQGLRYDDKKDAYHDVRANRWFARSALLLHRKPPLRLMTGQAFADEQIRAIEHMRHSPVTLLSGRGGTGKSETLAYEAQQYRERVMGAMEDIAGQYDASQVMFVAFTGQVASELARRTGFPAHTIHSVLFRHARYMQAYYRARSYRRHAVERQNTAPDKCGETFDKRQVDQCRDDRELRAYVEHHIEAFPPFASPFESTRVLLVDETSLLQAQLFKNLLEAAHNPAQGRFIERVILVGDLDQLPAIGYGNIQSDIAHGMPHCVCELIVNHRSQGTQLFSLAQAIAEHRFSLPMPASFDYTTAIKALSDPAHHDIVALKTGTHDLADNVELVLDKLGATANVDVRRSIQVIATTNDEVQRANDVMLWLYYGKNMTRAARDASGAVQIVRRRQTRLDGGFAGGDDDDDNDGGDGERERIMSQIKNQVYAGYRIFLKKNETIRFKGRSDGEPAREKRFYNSRLLEAVQFYNAPTRITQHIKCRCGLCAPAPRQGNDNALAAAFQPPVVSCMDRLDLVPPLRRGPPPPEGSNSFAWHNQDMPRRNDPTRRMGVFRDESGTYIELDVRRQMMPRTRYDIGYTLTTHKMQGSQQQIIIYICTNAASYINWKYIYTAATRAQRRLIILSTNEVFDRLVRCRERVRRSNLWNMLYTKSLEVLQEFPDSWSARRARRLLPQMFAASNSDERWAVFENIRYRTPAPAAAVVVPVIAAAPHRHVVEVTDDDDDDDEDDPDNKAYKPHSDSEEEEGEAREPIAKRTKK